jgi:diguanylate cyclase (GGDEF)-like protein
MVCVFKSLNELGEFPPDIARKLVVTLFQQRAALIIGGLVFVLFGCLCFIGTGSYWYLGGAVMSGSLCAWRIWQCHSFAVAPDSVSPVTWAWRSMIGAWAMGLGWGAWGAAIVFEPDKRLVAGVMAIVAGCVVSGAVRSCAVPIIAHGQILCTLTPMLAAYVAVGNMYMTFYAAVTLLHIITCLGLTRFLGHQTKRLLIQDQEKSALVASLEVARGDLELVNQYLETMSKTDALTGIANRRAFDLSSAREWGQSARERTPMSLLMIDVDHFKAFNDRYGHQSGDTCLQEIAGLIVRAVRRPRDMVARYGGEEFAVILPNTDRVGAEKIAADILQSVAGRALTHEASTIGPVTVSIGAACLHPQAGTAVEQLIALADAALYVAKRNGRNRIQTAEVTDESIAGGPPALVSN